MRNLHKILLQEYGLEPGACSEIGKDCGSGLLTIKIIEYPHLDVFIKN